MGIGEWYGGNSFYWWHNPSSGVEDLGELPDNWTKPNDFGNGNFHLRFEVLDQPTDSAFQIQLGFWQDKDKDGDTPKPSPRTRSLKEVRVP